MNVTQAQLQVPDPIQMKIEPAKNKYPALIADERGIFLMITSYQLIDYQILDCCTRSFRKEKSSSRKGSTVPF